MTLHRGVHATILEDGDFFKFHIKIAIDKWLGIDSLAARRGFANWLATPDRDGVLTLDTSLADHRIARRPDAMDPAGVRRG